MQFRRFAMVAAVFGMAAVVLAAGGCMGGGDVAQQLGSNEQFRGQVMDAITHHTPLATQVVDRIFTSDSLCLPMVDHILANDEVAKVVVVRIGTNPAALDMVLGVAARDSAMREHVITLVKGMEMAAQRGR